MFVSGSMQIPVDHRQSIACQEPWSSKNSKTTFVWEICTMWNVAVFRLRGYLGSFILTTGFRINKFLNRWSCFTAFSFANVVRVGLVLDGWGSCLADLNFAIRFWVLMFLYRWRIRWAGFYWARYFSISKSIYRYITSTIRLYLKNILAGYGLSYCPFPEKAKSITIRKKIDWKLVNSGTAYITHKGNLVSSNFWCLA